MNVNEKHKSSVFSRLFSTEDVLRELYSAIEGISIPPDTPININTLSNVLIKGLINDVSFTIDNRLVVLIEHQSSINSNMTLRLLLYIAHVYEKIINSKMMHQKKRLEIPTPEFIVLYNGLAPYPEREELRLSDAFKSTEGLIMPKNDKFSLELLVKVYNINYGCNAQILKKSEALEGYSFFISKIREYQKEAPLEEAMARAIKYCIEHGILRQFLEENSPEVVNMLLEEWNLDDALAVEREEGREEGREESMKVVARKALEKGATIDFVLEITGLPMEVIEQL